jgi:hypothetical protein
VKSEAASGERKPVRMVRVLRDAAEDDGSFDLDFWREVGAEGRLAAVWQMVGEARAFRGEVGPEPRLQRSAVRVFRR